MCLSWNLDVVIRADDGRRRLHEDDRLGRNRHPGLRRMVGVVEPDADELASPGDARPEARGAIDTGQLRGVESGETAQTRGPQRIAGNVVDVRAEVAKSPGRVDHTGAFGAGRAVSDELHRSLLKERRS